MGLERSEVQYGRTRISYAIRRSSRRGTVAVAVEPTGDVLLTAPFAVSVERLDRVVHQKARWIVGHWRKKRALDAPRAGHEFVGGETFFYLGRQYRLRIRAGAPSVRLHSGWLEVAVDGREHNCAEQVRAALVRWYRAQAERRLSERVAHWAEKLDLEVPGVLVREQQKRWASCDDKGVLRFNWRVIQAPLTAVDYVVVHELMHLLHRTHSSAYWRAVGRAMPDYEARRGHLRHWGPEAAW